MAPKGSTTEAAAAVRRTAIAACRGALQTTHSAANLVNLVDKEAARMLRTAEGLARSAVARLEFFGRKVTLNKKKEKDEEKDTDAAMGVTAAAVGSAPVPASGRGAPRRRRGRARKAALPLTAAEPPSDAPMVAGPLQADVFGAAPPAYLATSNFP